MNPSIENPFRNPAQRAKRRLFRDNDKQKNITKNLAAKLEHALFNYGPYKILYPQVQFLKELELLIPKETIERWGNEKLTAKEIIIERIEKVEAGQIISLNLGLLELTKLPKIPDSLKIFHCNDNKLSRLPPLPKTLLEFDCSVNNLTILPALPDSLKKLQCGANSLTKLPPLPKSLLELNCAYNRLIELPTLPKSLLKLNFFENKLTELPPLPISLKKFRGKVNNLTEEAKEKIKAHKNYNPKNFYL